MSPSPAEGTNGIGEKFSLFVGSIADGVENGWLEKILQVSLARSRSRGAPGLES